METPCSIRAGWLSRVKTLGDESILPSPLFSSAESLISRSNAPVMLPRTIPTAPPDPVPTAAGGHRPEPELDLLSSIVRTFNELFGNIEWKDADKIRQVIAEEIPEKVAADTAYQNAMKNSDRQNARIEHDRALGKVIDNLLFDHSELFKRFTDDPSFRKWLSDTIFAVTYTEAVE